MSATTSNRSNEVIFVLISEYAEWEPSVLAPGLRRGFGLWEPKYEVRTATPDGGPAMSIGGFQCRADYSFATLPADYAALVLVGGMSWWGEEAKRVVPLAKAARERGAVLGAICDASMFLGVNGFLNDVAHTSNSLSHLKERAGAAYTGEAGYREQPSVRDGNVVTANGVGFIEFAFNMFAALGVADQAVLDAGYAAFKSGMYPAG